MKGREFNKTSSTDFLVCFPSRSHLALLSKPVSSPVRLLQLPEPNSGRPTRHHPPPPPPQQPPRRLKKSGTARRPQASPVLWSKNKQMGSGSSVTSEPTSPKVTCAGQIKVRHKSGAGRSWQSVMAEIEKIHDGKTKKRGESSSSMLGFSKEIMQFLTCLKNVRFNFRCFGSFPEPEITSDDDEDEEEDDDDGGQGCNKYDEGDDKSRAVFSKWFMVLKENQNFPAGNDDGHRKSSSQRVGSWDEGSFAAAAVPPPNALLLMRCRSAPAKSWLEEKEEEEEEERVAMEKENDAVGNKLMESSEKKNILKILMDEEKREEEEDRKKKQSLFFEGYDTDYYNISTDVAKETWVVGATAMTDSLIRCPTIKR